jgi:hypothetical protein
MSEKIFFSLFTSDKTITNPLNKTEIFLCSDLYKDYRRCKAMYRKGLKSKSECREIRQLGQQCYLRSEEDFEKYLIKIFEEKRKYISYLKEEGSILYEYYKSDPTVFSVKKLGDEENQTSINEYLNENN